MVVNILDFNAAYFGDTKESNGIKTVYGYSNYLQTGQKNRFDEGKENQPYNPILKGLMDKLSGVNLSNISVLDIGGAVGFYSEYGKSLGVRSWTVLDLDIDTWCSRHRISSVDNFISGDAIAVLPTMRKNEYGVIFSSRFFECIADTDLPDLISEMNRVAKTKQIHIISETSNPLYYNEHELEWWSNQGFQKGTILISYNTQEVLVV